MSATLIDQARLSLEDTLAALVDADERLRCAGLRITSRMRTEAELRDLNEINAARRAVQRAKEHLAHWHPDRRMKDEG